MPFVKVKSQRYPDPVVINTDTILWVHSFQQIDRFTNQPRQGQSPRTRVFFGPDSFLDFEGNLEDVCSKLDIAVLTVPSSLPTSV